MGASADRSASALYVGRVAHTRHAPRPHRFSYPIRYLYLDLDELADRDRGPFARRWFWSVDRPNLASIQRRDLLGDPAVPLADAVRARAREVLGEAPPGPVRVLTLPRQFGYGFNPVSFYYLFESDGVTLGAVIAEITNTPWGERHSYVLGRATAHDEGAGLATWRFPKSFHVSPFFDLDHDYVWRFGVPGEQLVVAMENHNRGARVFDAGLVLERRPLSGRNLASFLLRHPAAAIAVQVAIHWQALRLWLKRTPFFTHPAKRNA